MPTAVILERESQRFFASLKNDTCGLAAKDLRLADVIPTVLI